MALDGPYFSHLLLLAFYLSGLRFSPNLSAQEREDRSARYMKLVMSLITEELSKPCSIPTARECGSTRQHSTTADGGPSERALTTRGALDTRGEVVLGRQPDAGMAVHRLGE